MNMPTNGQPGLPLTRFQQFVLNQRKRKRKRGVSGTWVFAVWAWAALTTLQVMLAIMSSTPISGLTDMVPNSGLPWMAMVAMWVAMTIIVLGISLVKKRSFRKALFSPAGMIWTINALFTGWFAGGILFSMLMVDGQIQASARSLENFNQVRVAMMESQAIGDDERLAWFDADGQLLPERKDAWCANALPRLQTYTDMATSPNEEGLAINGLLAQSLFSKVYQQGCITEKDLLGYMDDIHAKVLEGGRQQSVMEKLGWSAPILQAVARAHPLVLEKLTFTPKRACLKMAHTLIDPVAQADLCNTMDDNRSAREDELPRILQALAKLPTPNKNEVVGVAASRLDNSTSE